MGATSKFYLCNFNQFSNTIEVYYFELCLNDSLFCGTIKNHSKFELELEDN